MSRLIRDWLTEFKSLSEVDTKKYASSILTNHQLIRSLYDLFHEVADSSQVLDPVVHQLFEFYRSHHLELRRFTLQFVPTLLCVYLLAVSRNDKRSVNSIETTLLGIYNLEVVNEDGSPKTEYYKIPSLGLASIYHETAGFMPGTTLTESALSSYDSELRKIQYGPFPEVERVQAKNRLTVMTYVLRCYNADIANFPQMSHEAVCHLASRLCMTGFENLTRNYATKAMTKGLPEKASRRVTVNSSFLVELINSIYFVMFNGYTQAGIQALNDIHFRANHDLYADVTLVTNAIRNSLSQNPLGLPKEGPMGISIASSANLMTTSVTSNKSAITNASFRIKKLPDDISVGGEELTISEEPEKKTEEKTKAIDQITRPLKSVLKMGDKLRKDTKEKKDSPLSSPRKQSQVEIVETTSHTPVKSWSRTTATDSVELKKIVEKTAPKEVIESGQELFSNGGSHHSEVVFSSSGSGHSDVMFTCSESSLTSKNSKQGSIENDRSKVNPHSIITQV